MYDPWIGSGHGRMYECVCFTDRVRTWWDVSVCMFHMQGQYTVGCMCMCDQWIGTGQWQGL